MPTHKFLLKICVTLLLSMAVGCSDDDPAAPVAPPKAKVVQIDITSIFDSDIIANNGTGVLDPTQVAADDSTSGVANTILVTQGAAEELNPSDPDGLPNDGFFPADTLHPDVQLAYRNDDDGPNARRLLDNGNSLMFDVPSDRYDELHIFMISGQGSTEFVASLVYADTTIDEPAIRAPDWFFPVAGPGYALIDDMDRVRRDFVYDDRNAFAVFGIRFDPDPTRTLESVKVTRTTNNSPSSVLSFLGVTAVRSD